MGPVGKGSGRWRGRKNEKQLEICEDLSLPTYIKIQTIKWYGHVRQMNEGRQIRNVFHETLFSMEVKGHLTIKVEVSSRRRCRKGRHRFCGGQDSVGSDAAAGQRPFWTVVPMTKNMIYAMPMSLVLSSVFGFCVLRPVAD